MTQVSNPSSINPLFSSNTVKPIKEKPCTFNSKKITNSISKAIHLVGRFFANFSEKKQETPLSEQAWNLNLSLLRDIHSRTENPGLKQKIQFLATNYLSKSAPIDPKHFGKRWKKAETHFQISPFRDYHYHRCGFRDDPQFSSHFNSKFALEKTSPLILTNTDEFADFLPLSFTVLNESNQEDWEKNLAMWLQQTLSNSKKSIAKTLKTSPKPKLLFDLTTTFKDLIQTDSSASREYMFQEKFNQHTHDISETIDKAILIACKKNPLLRRHKKKLKEFIQKNSTSICRVNLGKVGGVKILPVFSSLKKNSWLKKHGMFNLFLGRTGLFLGALNLRRHVYNGLDLRKNLKSPPKGKASETYLQNRLDFTKLALFQRLSKKFSSKEFAKENPHTAILGQSTIELIDGLLHKVSQKKWKNRRKNPIKHELIQTSLFKLKKHLATAELHIDNFSKFSQEIELAHCEIAALLELLSPFNPQDFESICKEKLQGVPESLRPHMKARLCNSCSTVFAGINAALFQTNPDPTRVTTDDFYFEQSFLVGSRGSAHNFNNVMEDPSTDSIDLFSCQTNPNINVSKDTCGYEAKDIVGNIRRILEEKKKTKNLTVALDFTIDTFSSKKVQTILEEFENEINDGKLNIVAFRSGQKFDMYGMDNYYGGYFFMFNNGDDCWKHYNEMLLSKKKAMKTDPLSTQWFSLMIHASHDSSEKYRNLIFSNCRDILNQVPDSLKANTESTEKKNLWVSTLGEDTSTCFIDIKLTGNDHKARAKKLMREFEKECLSKGIKTCHRSSIGFYHLSYDLIPDKGMTSIRLKPGVNPKENPVISDFLRTMQECQNLSPIKKLIPSINRLRKSICTKIKKTFRKDKFFKNKKVKKIRKVYKKAIAYINDIARRSIMLLKTVIGRKNSDVPSYILDWEKKYKLHRKKANSVKEKTDQEKSKSLMNLFKEFQSQAPEGATICFKDFLLENGFSTTVSGIDFDISKLTTSNSNRESRLPKVGKPLLTGVSFEGVRFVDCNFNWTNLSNTSISACEFENCSFNHTVLQESEIRDTTFTNCLLDDANFNSIQGNNCSFSACSSINSNWNWSELDNVVVSDSDFSESTFLDTKFGKKTFTNSSNRDCFVESKRLEKIEGLRHEREKPTVALLWDTKRPGLSAYKTLNALKANGTIPIKVDFCSHKDTCLETLGEEVSTLLDRLGKQGIHGAETDPSGYPISSIPYNLIKEARENPEDHPELTKVIEKARLIVSNTDAIVIPGGEDLEPEFYGVSRKDAAKESTFVTPSYRPDYLRSSLEFAMLYWAVEKGTPISGICRGAQSVNVFYGGCLDPDQKGSYKVTQSLSKKENVPGQIAASLTEKPIKAFSYHHQVINDIPPHLDLVMTHKDKTPKALEGKSSLPVLLYQFHPEFKDDYINHSTISFSNFLSPENRNLFRLITDNAKASYQRKHFLHSEALQKIISRRKGVI